MVAAAGQPSASTPLLPPRSPRAGYRAMVRAVVRIRAGKTASKSKVGTAKPGKLSSKGGGEAAAVPLEALHPKPWTL